MREIESTKAIAGIAKFESKSSTGLVLLPRQWPSLLALAAILAFIPFVIGNDYYLLLFNLVALNGLVVLGLNLLIGSTGQVSLGHAAFYGIGAYFAAIASTTWHWPLWAAFILPIAAVALAAFLLAIPTLRLEGHYLVMATLGFNIIVTTVLNQWEEVTGGPSGFPGIPKLGLGGIILKTDRSFYFFIWSVFLLIFALTLNLLDSCIGRALETVHEKDLTAQTLGIPSFRYKVAVFVLSAVYAGIAGFCYAHYMTFISPKTFDIFYSVQIVIMVVVGGMGSIWGGLAGAALLTLLPEFLHRFEDVHVLLYGLILVGVLVFCPEGMIPAILRLKRSRKNPEQGSRDKRTGRDMEPSPHLASFRSLCAMDAGDLSKDGMPLLDLNKVSLAFGGIQALLEVSAQVYPGEIVALIGPNGAGKTTMLNLISGLLKPGAGQISLKGRSIRNLAPYRIAGLGVGRTFQTVQIYQKLTVLENVLVGYHVHGKAGFFQSLLHLPDERRTEAVLRERGLSLLQGFQLLEKADLPVERLSLIEQKLLELARALSPLSLHPSSG